MKLVHFRKLEIKLIFHSFEQNVISVKDGITYPKNKLPLSAIEGQYSPWKYILIEGIL